MKTIAQIKGISGWASTPDGRGVILDMDAAVEGTEQTLSLTMPYEGLGQFIGRLMAASRDAETKLGAAQHPQGPVMRPASAMPITDAESGSSRDGRYVTLELWVDGRTSILFALPADKAPVFRERIAKAEISAQRASSIPHQETS